MYTYHLLDYVIYLILLSFISYITYKIYRKDFSITESIITVIITDYLFSVCYILYVHTVGNHIINIFRNLSL